MGLKSEQTFVSHCLEVSKTKKILVFAQVQILSNNFKNVTLYNPLPYTAPNVHDSANSHPAVCPSCSNVLTVSTIHPSTLPQSSSVKDPQDPFSSFDFLASEQDNTLVNRLECQTCPYQYLLKKSYYERKVFVRKEREDVFGGPGAWDNADKCKIQCPVTNCDGEEAAFFQVQIRSADEPMTGFYKVSVKTNGRVARRYWGLNNWTNI